MSFRRPSCAYLCSSLALLLAGPALCAQASSQSSSSSKPAGKATSRAASPLDSGSVSAGKYRNRAFGFTCKIPPGWVLRTDELNARDDERANPDNGQTDTDSGQAGRVLLAAFSRPPQARGEDVNSSILIAAESAASYPGLKEAAQYFGPVTEVAKAQGFEIDDQPYQVVFATKRLRR